LTVIFLTAVTWRPLRCRRAESGSAKAWLNRRPICAGFLESRRLAHTPPMPWAISTRHARGRFITRSGEMAGLSSL